MKILVTGANGYLGQGIVTQLLKDGFNIIATDIVSKYIDKEAQIKTADIFSLEDPFTYFSEPDVLLHLAWENGFVHNHISHMIDLPKHYLFLKKMTDSGLKHLAVMGSMHEIGFYEGSIKESTPTMPQSLYGISKDALRRSLELLVKEKKIVFQWLRGYYIVGNSAYGSSIFSKISAAAGRGECTFPFTSGQNQWDFLDYADFCFQTAKVVEQTKINGIINICSGKPEKLADRVERFISDNHFTIKLQYGAYPDRPYDSKAVWGDDDKIRKIIYKENAD